MPIDVDLLRSRTPGASARAHLNNAGAALPSAATLESVVEHLRLEATIGGYEAATAAAAALDGVRSSVAALLGASQHEIALTISDSQAFQKAFWALARGRWFRPGDVIAVDDMSYNSHHLALLQAVELLGVRLQMVRTPSDVAPNVRLLALTLIATHSGAVNDVSGYSAVARSMEIPFFLDGCQAVGQMPVDVSEIGCDVLTGTGRKWLRGPRGTGFLYVRDLWIDRLEPLGIDGHSASWTGPDQYRVNADATRFDEFEYSVAARIGLGVAVRELLDAGVDEVSQRIARLSAHLRSGLASLPTVSLEDGSGRSCGIVTFTVSGTEPGAVMAAAARASINVNTTSGAWVQGAHRPKQVVRASPHAYNTEHELDRLLEVVASL